MGKGIVDKLKQEFEIEDEWLPLEIHPETPPDGVNMADLFPPSSLEGMFRNLKRMGSEYGIEFNAASRLSNSHLSLAAGEYAKEMGKFHEFHKEAFHVYFTEGRDIGDIETILSIGERAGLNREELQKRLVEGYYDEVLDRVSEEAHNNRINSTPTFIIDGKYAVVGAQPIDNFRDTLLKIEKQQ